LKTGLGTTKIWRYDFYDFYVGAVTIFFISRG